MRDKNIEQARSLYYAMFSRFFVLTPNIERYHELVELIDILADEPLDDNSKLAFIELKKYLKLDSNVPLLKEYDELFYSPLSKSIPMTASFYDEGVESGKKRLQMTKYLSETNIRREETKYFEYEDSVGFIFSVLSELCTQRVNEKTDYYETEIAIFENILNEFIDQFTKELFEHDKSRLFKHVAAIIKSFIDFERLYLEVSKPTYQNQFVENSFYKEEQLSQEELDRRARNKALKAQGPKQQMDSSTVIFDIESEL